MPPLVPPTPHRPLGNASELVPHDLRECDSLAARRSRPGSAANCVARRLTQVGVPCLASPGPATRHARVPRLSSSSSAAT